MSLPPMQKKDFKRYFHGANPLGNIFVYLSCALRNDLFTAVFSVILQDMLLISYYYLLPDHSLSLAGNSLWFCMLD